jgi:hypothetical protein
LGATGAERLDKKILRSLKPDKSAASPKGKAGSHLAQGSPHLHQATSGPRANRRHSSFRGVLVLAADYAWCITTDPPNFNCVLKLFNRKIERLNSWDLEFLKSALCYCPLSTKHGGGCPHARIKAKSGLHSPAASVPSKIACGAGPRPNRCRCAGAAWGSDQVRRPRLTPGFLAL